MNTPTDFRALCAELTDALDAWQLGGGPPEDTAFWRICLITRARLILAEPEPSDEELLALMPQEMRADLAAASRALAEEAGVAPGVFRVLLNRHVLDYARIVLSHGSANE